MLPRSTDWSSEGDSHKRGDEEGQARNGWNEDLSRRLIHSFSDWFIHSVFPSTNVAGVNKPLQEGLADKACWGLIDWLHECKNLLGYCCRGQLLALLHGTWLRARSTLKHELGSPTFWAACAQLLLYLLSCSFVLASWCWEEAKRVRRGGMWLRRGLWLGGRVVHN